MLTFIIACATLDAITKWIDDPESDDPTIGDVLDIIVKDPRQW
jgi:hypothetical protein